MVAPLFPAAKAALVSSSLNCGPFATWLSAGIGTPYETQSDRARHRHQRGNGGTGRWAVAFTEQGKPFASVADRPHGYRHLGIAPASFQLHLIHSSRHNFGALMA